MRPGGQEGRRFNDRQGKHAMMGTAFGEDIFFQTAKIASQENRVFRKKG